MIRLNPVKRKGGRHFSFCYLLQPKWTCAHTLSGAFTSPWILTRAKQVSTGHLFTPVCGLVPPFRIHSHPLPIIKATPSGCGFYYWQRMRDSNPRKRSQSPVCYRYTNPLSRGQVYYMQFFEKVKGFSNFLSRTITGAA